ncbi:MAG: hypothetical protein ACRDK5_11170, partial [Solirubrobacterales bacterium]
MNRGRSDQGNRPPEEADPPRERQPRDQAPPGREPSESLPELDFGFDDDLGREGTNEPRRQLGRSSKGGNGKRANGSGVRGLLEEARRRVSGNGSDANGATEAPPRDHKPPLIFGDDEPIGEPDELDQPDEFPP